MTNMETNTVAKRYVIRICMICKKEYGQRTALPENYGLGTGDLKSHGYCPVCAEKMKKGK